MWALGVTIYQCITYKLPFTGNGIEFKKQLMDPLYKIPELKDDEVTYSWVLDIYKWIVPKLLERDPKNRMTA